jgi:uncharacterized protein DUF6599
MRKLHVIFGVFALLGTGSDTLGATDLAKAFPDKFGKWSAGGPAASVKPGEGLVAEVDAEAGLVATLARQYANGTQSVTVKLRQYRDPSSAYQAYTARLTMETLPSTVGVLSGVRKDELILLAGNLLMEVRSPNEPTTAELQELAKFIRGKSDQTPLPPIRTFLPQGLSDGTQRYVAGPKGFVAALDSLHRSQYRGLAPEIGFANSAEAMLAEYRKGKESAVLLLIEYPTQHLAEQQLRHLQTVLPGIGGSEVKVVRKASLLSMVLAPTSPEYADGLTKGVSYETEVTWNEGSHALTDPPWVVVLSRIFMATGLFLVVAIVLGVAFGGVRILTKRLLPGKVFDRPQDIEVLQLGLGSKRIDPSDFYRR